MKLQRNAISLTPREVLELVHDALHHRGVHCHPSSVEWIGETRSVVVRPPPGEAGRDFVAELIVQAVTDAPRPFWEIVGRCALTCEAAEDAIEADPRLELVDPNSDHPRVRIAGRGRRGRRR